VCVSVLCATELSAVCLFTHSSLGVIIIEQLQHHHT
jgi:hypothetical protein